MPADFIVRRLRIGIEQNFCVHDHPVRAIAALQGALREEGRLQRVRLRRRSQALEGRHAAVLHRSDRCDARPRRLAIEKNSAGAALGETTAEFWTIEREIVSQDIEQWCFGIGVDAPALAVYDHGYSADHRGCPLGALISLVREAPSCDFQMPGRGRSLSIKA